MAAAGQHETLAQIGHEGLERRQELVHAPERDDEVAIAFDCVSAAGAKGCGFGDYGLAAGARADLVLVEARSLAEAVVARPVRKIVVSAGRIVARDGALLA